VDVRLPQAFSRVNRRFCTGLSSVSIIGDRRCPLGIDPFDRELFAFHPLISRNSFFIRIIRLDRCNQPSIRAVIVDFRGNDRAVRPITLGLRLDAAKPVPGRFKFFIIVIARILPRLVEIPVSRPIQHTILIVVICCLRTRLGIVSHIRDPVLHGCLDPCSSPVVIRSACYSETGRPGTCRPIGTIGIDLSLSRRNFCGQGAVQTVSRVCVICAVQSSRSDLFDNFDPINSAWISSCWPWIEILRTIPIKKPYYRSV